METNRRHLSNPELKATEPYKNELWGVDDRFVRLVDDCIRNAVRSKASDIHLEPFFITSGRIRFRIDGRLVEYKTIDKNDFQGMVARLKILAKLDIAEKWKPMDGHFSCYIGKHIINIRIAILPLIDGEKIVLRIFENEHLDDSLEKLGLFGNDLDRVKMLIALEQGLVLFCGPTGCGKTTTAYRMLTNRNSEDVNIMTIEDPPEIDVAGINQIRINPKNGMTIDGSLRACMRHDPDIIMIGEIREQLVGQAACQAALTGHLVLSTLHTMDALSSVTRLLDLNVPAYMIREVLKGVISQRLVRRLCPLCKEAYPPSDEERRWLGGDVLVNLYRAKGCSQCNKTGYSGRIGIFEVMTIKPSFSSLETSQMDKKKVAEHCVCSSIIDNVQTLIRAGIIDMNEAFRVIGVYDGG